MSEPCCTATTRAGQPCAVCPLPGSDYCLFHDPAHHQALTESRSKGGSTPRRRTRRYPLLLDFKHVAELLSELFVAALNEPAPLDAPRLRALTGLSKVLLQAVGRPKGIYEIHLDRTEPSPDEDSLLRIYPPDPPELARLLAVDTEIEAALDAEAPDPSDPSAPSAPAPAPQPPTLNPQSPIPPLNRAGNRSPNRTCTGSEQPPRPVSRLRQSRTPRSPIPPPASFMRVPSL